MSRFLIGKRRPRTQLPPLLERQRGGERIAADVAELGEGRRRAPTRIRPKRRGSLKTITQPALEGDGDVIVQARPAAPAGASARPSAHAEVDEQTRARRRGGRADTCRAVRRPSTRRPRSRASKSAAIGTRRRRSRTTTPVDARADDVRQQRTADGLDFRQLGHGHAVGGGLTSRHERARQADELVQRQGLRPPPRIDAEPAQQILRRRA